MEIKLKNGDVPTFSKEDFDLVEEYYPE